MADRGDKYIIEIADTSHITQDDGLKRQIYRIKGFNTLILDDYALSKLEELEKATVDADEAFSDGYLEGYNKGYKEGYQEGYKEAAETIRLDRQNEEADEIHVGDEVEIDGYIGVVSCVESDGWRIMDKEGDADFYGNHCDIRKTGRHFEQITDLLKAMRDESE